MRKKVDARVRTLIENSVALRHRGLFVIVGDSAREQVVNLHYMLSKAAVRARPSVLWCYKKELGFTTHRKKRMRHIKKMAARGLIDPDKDDPFELFISSTSITYCYYRETTRVLGNTFGMLVLQDFEAVTPNVLARTVETVEARHAFAPASHPRPPLCSQAAARHSLGISHGAQRLPFAACSSKPEAEIPPRPRRRPPCCGDARAAARRRTQNACPPPLLLQPLLLSPLLLLPLLLQPVLLPPLRLPHPPAPSPPAGSRLSSCPLTATPRHPACSRAAASS